MRRTIITPNRFTIFTLSWQAKAAGLGLCFFLLLFFSCKDDDVTYIGFRKGSRLNTRFVDIPLKKSVVQYNGVLTRNSKDETVSRILVGRYNDPKFGNMEARGFVNFAPPVQTVKVPIAATLDYLELQVRFDFYYYGSRDVALQRIQVFPLIDALNIDQKYYNNSTVSFSSVPVGDTTFLASPFAFDNADTSAVQIVRIRIKGSLGSDLLYDLLNEPDIINDFAQFSSKYPGFAFVMPQGDKIFGIDPQYSLPYPKSGDTMLSLYYSAAGLRSRVDFPLFYGNHSTTGSFRGVTSFSSITADRAPTPLNGIEAFKEFTSPDNQLYIQSGSALIAKFDLDNFYNYVDTLTNIVFNSAELVVNNVSDQKAPTDVQLRVLDSINRFRSYRIDSVINDVSTPVNDPYFLKIAKAISVGPLDNPTIDIRTDVGTSIAVTSDTRKIDRIYITEFCQQIYWHKHHPRRIKSLALMPVDTEFEKTVSGLLLDPSATLRIYYSKPVSKAR